MKHSVKIIHSKSWSLSHCVQWQLVLFLLFQLCSPYLFPPYFSLTCSSPWCVCVHGSGLPGSCRSREMHLFSIRLLTCLYMNLVCSPLKCQIVHQVKSSSVSLLSLQFDLHLWNLTLLPPSHPILPAGRLRLRCRASTLLLEGRWFNSPHLRVKVSLVKILNPKLYLAWKPPSCMNYCKSLWTEVPAKCKCVPSLLLTRPSLLLTNPDSHSTFVSHF